MKIFARFIIFLLPILFLAASARSYLNRTPLTVFLLKGGDDIIEAFHLNLYLDGRDSTVESISLTAEQKKIAALILNQKNIKGLSALSGEFGKASVLIGSTSSDESWPPLLGGGFQGLLNSEKGISFDNLFWTDRLYLCLGAKAPPPPPLLISENKSSDKNAPAATPQAGNPVTVTDAPATLHPGALRVEILNGCGIKGAAEWAARRFKGAGILIIDTGNAEHFHFAQTQVWTSAGVPVSLEDALDRLGLSRDAVQESTSTPSTVDVVVVVGKDYRLLKERVRDRRHNGTK